MSNHEYWNELGNLYFMNGAYQPAIHAYLRAIELDGRFGRSYSNLAAAFVKVGKYAEAIKLYRHSIELLTDEREKVVTWNKLGILYRQIMENDHALEDGQHPNLNTQQELSDEEIDAEAVADADLPLTVSMPDIDMDSILGAIHLDDVVENDDPLSINAALESAEEEGRIAWFEGEFMPPTAEMFLEENEAVNEAVLNIQSEWRLAYSDEITSIDMASLIEEEMVEEDAIYPEIDALMPVDVHNEVKSIQRIEFPLPELEDLPESAEAMEEHEVQQEEDSYEHRSLTETDTAVGLSETEPESAEYSQVEYPLMELSEAERNSLEMDIAKYKFASQNNPRNYSIWEMLGDAYKAVGKYKDAIKAFQTAISINSTKPSFYYRLGLIYAIEGREAEAVSAFQRVLELDPNYAQAHASLASHYQKMGLEELAQSHIEKALNTEFEEESEYNRACLEAICGHNDRALELLEVALRTKQTYINWAQVDPDFDSLRKDQRFYSLLSTYAASA